MGIHFIANELADIKMLNVPQLTQKECFKARSGAQCVHQAF